MHDTKTCVRCSVAYPLDNFYVAPGNADSRASRCQRCCILDARTPIGEFETAHARRVANAKQRQGERDEAYARRRFQTIAGTEIPLRPEPHNARVRTGGKR